MQKVPLQSDEDSNLLLRRTGIVRVDLHCPPVKARELVSVVFCVVLSDLHPLIPLLWS
jgi:hypothetical protein